MSDNLQFNTILGCGIAAVLGVLGLREAGNALYGEHYPEKPGFAPEVTLAVASGGGAAAAPKPIDFGTLYADPALYGELVAKGEKLHAACKSCHTFEAGGANGTGPNLYGILNRASASHPGFAYSDAMKAHGKPWTYEELSSFLLAPNSYVKGTKMAYAGLKKPDDRAAMIAYLRTLAPSPAALPAPLPAEAPATEAPPTEGAPAEPQKT